MSTTFPTTIDTFVNPQPTDSMSTVSHSTQHTHENDALLALETKVGANSSAVNTSLDYKLGGVVTGDKAVSLTGNEVLTNKTLTTPTIGNFTNAGHNHQGASGGGQLTEAALSLSDVTTANVSSTAHGFAPKYPNNTTTFLRGDGTYAAPPAASVTITSSTSSTPSVVTTAGQRLTIIVKGNITIGSGSPGSLTANMKVNGSTVSSQTNLQNPSGAFSLTVPINFMYTSIPGAQTNSITFDQTIGDLFTVMMIN